MKEISYFLLLVISINLDCFTSSVTEGFLLKSINYKRFLQIGITFGLFFKLASPLVLFRLSSSSLVFWEEDLQQTAFLPLTTG